jgi:hypothetical protein
LRVDEKEVYSSLAEENLDISIILRSDTIRKYPELLPQIIMAGFL